MMAGEQTDHPRLITLVYLALFLLGKPLSASALVAQNRFLVLFDSSNHLHRDIKYHPEQPERIKLCVQALKD
jgi:hypothetical protein